MIRVLGIDHAAISVRDLEVSRKFYEDVLGLKVSEREYQKPGTEYFLDCGVEIFGGDAEGHVIAAQPGVLHEVFFTVGISLDQTDEGCSAVEKIFGSGLLVFPF